MCVREWDRRVGTGDESGEVLVWDFKQQQYGQGGHLGEAGGHSYEPGLGHGEEAGLVVGAHCVASGSSRGQGWSFMGDTTVCVYSVISARVVTTLHTHPEKCGDPQGRSVWWQAVLTMLCLCGGGGGPV